METTRERDLRIQWMRDHFKLGDKAPFAELQDITLRVKAESETNRREMQPSKGPLNFKFVDGLTAQIAARREKGK